MNCDIFEFDRQKIKSKQIKNREDYHCYVKGLYLKFDISDYSSCRFIIF